MQSLLCINNIAQLDGVKFHAFNIDPEFNHCVDGLVMVDIQQLKPKKYQRYIAEDKKSQS